MNSDRSSSTNYINPNGLDRIIEYYTRDSARFFSKGLTDLSYDVMDNKWVATCTSGSINTYEGVVLTIPAPKVLEIQGNYRNYLPNSFLDRLMSVQYSSR
jgi:predicted NAD/FAD-dependent oxidoreductase